MPRNRGVTKSDEPPDDARVLANRYKIVRKLGAGNFGTAFLCKDLKANGELKVLKEIMCGDLAPDETVDAVHEAKLLSKLNHVNIVRFHDSFLDNEFFCIVTEYCEGGDLEDRMTSFRKKGKHFEESTVLNWFVQLVAAVKHMHSRRVLHRDLKARNIFLNKDNMIKIGDFGISRMLMGTTDMASTFVGTPYYMSPEALKHEGYNSKSDLWSVGCLLYEMCELKHAFEGQGLMGVMYRIVEGNCPTVGSKYSKEINSLVQRLLEKDPDKRASATEVLQNQFVKRHIEKFKTELTNPSAPVDNTMIATKEAHEMSQELSKKWYKEQLVKEEEQETKEMTPRERMRLKKMAAADDRAKQLQEQSQEQFATNKMIRETRKEQDNLSSTLGGGLTEARFQDVGYSAQAASSFRPKTAPGNSVREQHVQPTVQVTVFPELEPELDRGAMTVHYAGEFAGVADDLSHMTLVAAPRDVYSSTLRPSAGPSPAVSRANSSRSRRSQVYEGPDKPHMAGTAYNSMHNTWTPDDRQWVPDGRPWAPDDRPLAPDDRPITPMRDRMVYDVEHSSLDFDEGIPADPTLADTYYSQYEDFEKEGDDQGYGTGEPEPGTTLGPSGTLVAGEMGGTYSDFVRALEGCMNPDAETTVTFGDEMGAFGPAAKEAKMKKMKGDCQKKLGGNFDKVYKFLKEARFGSKPKSEAEIMSGLRAMEKNTSDCFLVEQLLFLEYQSVL